MMARLLSRLSWQRHGVTTLRVLMVVALLVWPLIFDNKYHMRIMTTAGLYALLTIGVVIVLGQAGQLSFGHFAFYRHRCLYDGYAGSEDARTDAGLSAHRGTGGRSGSAYRRPAGAEAALLLPGLGHDRSHTDLLDPGDRHPARGHRGGYRHRSGTEVRTVRRRVQQCTAEVLLGLGDSDNRAHVHRSRRSSTAWGGPSGP